MSQHGSTRLDRAGLIPARLDSAGPSYAGRHSPSRRPDTARVVPETCPARVGPSMPKGLPNPFATPTSYSDKGKKIKILILKEWDSMLIRDLQETNYFCLGHIFNKTVGGFVLVYYKFPTWLN